MHAPGQVVFSGTSFAPRDDATRIAPPVRFLGGGFGCARINKDVNTPTSFLSALSRSPLSSLSDAHPDSQPIVARRPFQNKNGVRGFIGRTTGTTTPACGKTPFFFSFVRCAR